MDDQELTWNILSVLAAASPGGDPPFFAQREAAETQTGDASSASDGEEAAFVQACPLRDGGCVPALYSQQAICKESTSILMLHGGRMSAAELGAWLGMEEDDVARVGVWLCREDGEPSSKGRVRRVANPATQQQDYAMVESLKARLRERMELHCGGSSSSDDEYIPSLEELAQSRQGGEWAPIATVATKQLARELDLTIDDVAWLLEEELGSADASSTFTVVRSKSGVLEKVFNQGVADRYRYLERQLSSALSGVTAPTSLEKLLGHDFGGEESAATIIATVQSLSHSGDIYGTLSFPPKQASLANAIYTPHLYSLGQRKIADSFYRTNGYLTEKKCIALGISRNRIEDFVKESFPNAMLLTQSIIDLDAICRPLEIAVQSAILNKTFANLRAHLPADIASSEEDTKAIIEVHLAALLQEQPQMHDAFAEGIRTVNGDMALFFSREMVEDCKALLPLLVESYSKQRAKEIVAKEGGGENDLIPLLAVAEAVRKKYPDLLILQSNQGHNFDANDAISWSNDASNDGPLVEFCRCAIFSSELQRMCARSVKAELAQLNTQHGVSVSSQAAAKIANIGESFEASFRTLCHLLQMFSKSLDVIGSRAQQSSEGESIDQMVDRMKRELLLGCGSCLARLITEYYSFKHEGETESEGSRLFFESCGEAGNATAAVDGIDLATMNFTRYELKCRKCDSGKSQSDPLKYLRSAYAGSPGLSLSQMWSLCSSDDDSNSEAGKKLKAFVELLGEACLMLVGVPFSVLDKKTEKRVLAARREGLMERLDKSQDNEEMARCAAILIYQQVKSLPIAGVDTTNAVVRLFEHDRKIPPEVTQDLLTLRTCDDSDAPMGLILRVKKYGSAKNAKALASLVDKEQH